MGGGLSCGCALEGTVEVAVEGFGLEDVAEQETGCLLFTTDVLGGLLLLVVWCRSSTVR